MIMLVHVYYVLVFMQPLDKITYIDHELEYIQHSYRPQCTDSPHMYAPLQTCIIIHTIQHAACTHPTGQRQQWLWRFQYSIYILDVPHFNIPCNW